MVGTQLMQFETGRRRQVAHAVDRESGHAEAAAVEGHLRAVVDQHPSQFARVRGADDDAGGDPEAMKALVVVSAINLPRPMTTSRSAVCAISESRWLETSTVRPSAASDCSSSRSQRTPSGRGR